MLLEWFLAPHNPLLSTRRYIKTNQFLNYYIAINNWADFPIDSSLPLRFILGPGYSANYSRLDPVIIYHLHLAVKSCRTRLHRLVKEPQKPLL